MWYSGSHANLVCGCPRIRTDDSEMECCASVSYCIGMEATTINIAIFHAHCLAKSLLGMKCHYTETYICINNIYLNSIYVVLLKWNWYEFETTQLMNLLQTQSIEACAKAIEPSYR